MSIDRWSFDRPPSSDEEALIAADDALLDALGSRTMRRSELESDPAARLLAAWVAELDDISANDPWIAGAPIATPSTSSKSEGAPSRRVWAVSLQPPLSVAHSFNVQNYNSGNPKGDLIVRGSIAQKWRGALGTFSGSTSTSGYAKGWAYDARLAYLTPPKFLDPVATSWILVETSEDRPISP